MLLYLKKLLIKCVHVPNGLIIDLVSGFYAYAFLRSCAKLSSIYNHVNPMLTILTLVFVFISRVKISASKNRIAIVLIITFVYKRLKECQNILHFIV